MKWRLSFVVAVVVVYGRRLFWRWPLKFIFGAEIFARLFLANPRMGMAFLRWKATRRSNPKLFDRLSEFASLYGPYLDALVEKKRARQR